MVWIRIKTRTEQNTCMYVFEICAEGIIVTLPWWLENVKSRSKIAIALFQMSAILKFDFQKREQLRFSAQVNYLNYTKKTQFCMWQLYIFPKTRGNKNKPWTHSTPLKGALDNYNIYLFIPNSLEDIKLDQYRNFQRILPMRFHFVRYFVNSIIFRVSHRLLYWVFIEVIDFEK